MVLAGAIDASTSETSLGKAWWGQPKVIIALVSWVIFALLCHVRFAPALRGRRAALLGLAGFAMIVAALAMAMAAGEDDTQQPTYIEAPTD